MSPNRESDFIEVFAGTTWQAQMVKTLLENSEITTFLKDEFLGTLNPWWAAPGGAGAVKVFISNSDYEKAKAIIADYEKNLNDTQPLS
jgi:hypothetical protein